MSIGKINMFLYNTSQPKNQLNQNITIQPKMIELDNPNKLSINLQKSTYTSKSTDNLRSMFQQRQIKSFDMNLSQLTNAKPCGSCGGR